MFLDAIRGFLGYGSLAAMFYTALWSLSETASPASMQAAPVVARVVYVLLLLGLTVGWVLSSAAAILCAIWPFAEGRRSETR